MRNSIHVYCDESCHLPNDQQTKMVLGALWCPADRRKSLADKVKILKKKHGLSPSNEIKWVKVSQSKVEFYTELVALFFAEDSLHFRGVVIDKSELDHANHQQTHDDFYYKMWWQCLTMIIREENRYRIFIDIKDTQGNQRVKKLQEVLCNAHYDFDKSIIESVELVHSHDVILLQLTDLLLGAVGYFQRGLSGNAGKEAVIQAIQKHSGHSLTCSTLPTEEKFNLFLWRGRS